MTKNQTVVLMAATIYAARATANSNRHLLGTLQKGALKEAQALYETHQEEVERTRQRKRRRTQ